jgi:hypothetical protein
MPRSSSCSLLAAFALALAGGCSNVPGEDPSLLIGRLWLDSKPQKHTDYVHGAFLLPRPSFGWFQHSSSYDLHFERFDYKRDGQRLELSFPQTGKRAEVTFTVTACDALPPFDLCLDLSDNPWGGPKRYYGKRKADDEDERAMRGMRAHLPER